MKHCPTCKRPYEDTLSFCLDDGTPLVASPDSEATLVMPTPSPELPPTLTAPVQRAPTSPTVANLVPASSSASRGPALYILTALLALIAGGGLVALLKSGTRGGSTSNEQSSVQLPESKPAATATPETITTRVEVPANRMWTNTGVVVAAGDTLTIRASGQVNGSVRDIDANRWVDPDGWPQSPQIASYSKASWVLGRTAYMCLTGKLGANGKPFKVGSSYSMGANSGGTLFLGINDELIDENGNVVSDTGLGWQDNSGSFDVHITVKK